MTTNRRLTVGIIVASVVFALVLAAAALVPTRQKPEWLPDSTTDVHTGFSGPEAEQRGELDLDGAASTSGSET